MSSNMDLLHCFPTIDRTRRTALNSCYLDFPTIRDCALICEPEYSLSPLSCFFPEHFITATGKESKTTMHLSIKLVPVSPAYQSPGKPEHSQ